MEFNKKMSKSGAVTIPAALRRDIGIEHGEKLSITVQDDGNILLKRIQGNCIFCKTDENVKPFKGKFICSSCKKSLGKD